MTAEPDVSAIVVADGLQVQQVADAALVRWPVVADWDARGRLVVVESGGVGWPIQEHNQQLLHRIVRLVDEDGDGVFDRRILAADKLPFTEGVLCLGDSLLAAAPPHIWRLTDKDGDGYCEQREVWFDGQTLTNCANDLHGPYLGRDGWIYWCKGAFGEQTHALPNGRQQTDRAAHIFRRPLAGGPLDIVISGGMDNPVELAETPLGERFFTSTFLQHPGDGRRDGMGHAILGSVFGKDHNVLDGLLRTGPLMPIMTHLGPAAPSGLACPPANHAVLGTQSELTPHPEGVLLSAQFNLHKVAAHALVPDANGSFSTRDVDLLWTDRVDFHPTDVLADHDSLLVIDTGGWYDLCCPTSRVDQQVAAGGIYRIRTAVDAERAATPATRPAHSAEDWLVALDDPRPWLRRSALLQLGAQGDAAVPALSEKLEDRALNLAQQVDVLWALSHVGTPAALQVVADSLPEGDCHQLRPASLARVCCQILATHRYQPARSRLEELLADDPPPHVLRVTAMALGRVGNARSVEPLMAALGTPRTGALEHALLRALLDLGATESVASFLESEHPGQRRAALLVLDQLASDLLDPAIVLATFFESGQGGAPRLHPTCLDILQKHTDWAAQLAAPLKKHLQTTQPTQAEQRSWLQLLSAWRDQEAVQALVAELCSSALPGEDAVDGPWFQLDHSAEIWEGSEAPPALVALWSRWLEVEPAKAARGLASVRLQSAANQPLVQQIHEQIADTEDLELQALLAEALPPGEVLASDRLAAAWREQKQFAKLAAFRLTPAQAQPLLDELPNANALQLPHILTALASAEDAELTHAWLQRLESLPVARTLDSNLLPNLVRQHAADVQAWTQRLNEKLQATPQDVQQSVARMLQRLPNGDPVRGLQVFRSQRAACSACHQMGYIGGRIGPELTRIGKTRTREALLEAILFPNTRIEQSYRPTRVLTHDGDVHNGLVLSQDAKYIELQITADQTVRIARQELALEQPGSLSIMPGGLQELLTDQQLADLLALLESAK